jgi:hypothetical protein
MKVETVVPGRLEVWNFTLPSYDVMPNNGYAELDSSEFAHGKLADLAVEDMKTFGMNIISIHPVEMPKIVELGQGNTIMKIDTRTLETRLSQVVRRWRETPGSDKLKLSLSISGMYDLGVKGLDDPLPNSRWQTVLNQWVKVLVAMMTKYGLSYDDWFMSLGDEASESALVNLEIPVAKGLKLADSRIRLINNTSTTINDPEMAKQFYKTFDILQPHLPQFKSQIVLRRWMQQADKPIWTYKCLGDLGALGKNPYEYYRVYGWDLVKYGLTGSGLWTYCAQAQSQPNAGFILIYKHPERDLVLHSRRFEFFREGIDDYRYIWKLREVVASKGPSAVKSAEALIVEAVSDVIGHPADSNRADLWRTKIAERILKYQTGN